MQPAKQRMLNSLQNDETFGTSIVPTNREGRRKLAKLLKQQLKQAGKKRHA